MQEEVSPLPGGEACQGQGRAALRWQRVGELSPRSATVLVPRVTDDLAAPEGEEPYSGGDGDQANDEEGSQSLPRHVTHQVEDCSFSHGKTFPTRGGPIGGVRRVLHHWFPETVSTASGGLLGLRKAEPRGGEGLGEEKRKAP